MYSTRICNLTAGALVITLLAGLSALFVMQPAQASHPPGVALEITPEVSGATLVNGTANAAVTARLVDADGDPALAVVPVTISFEVLGGPADPDGGDKPETPDRQCTISPTQSECQPTPPISATSAGSSLIRGWIDGHEADTTEGRLSHSDRDCSTEPPAAVEACRTGTPAPGGTAERDTTDVVVVQFTTGAAELDCSPEDGKAPPGENARVRCTALDGAGDPVAGQRLDGENKNGKNDPDSADGGTADYDDACITGENGACTVTIGAVKNELGTAAICVWVDADNDDIYSPGGNTAADGGDCGEALTAQEGANTTDVVSVEWQNRALTSLDVTPDVPSASTAGGTHTMTATALDQFGAKWTTTSATVSGEFFSGSPNDTDANTPATPDLGSCNTTSGDSDEDKSSCTFAYTSGPSPGTDVMCFWFGDAPAMSGSHIGNSTCAGEGVVSNEVPRVDVVSKRWVAAPTTTPAEDDASQHQGYTLVGADGGIFTYGTSKFHGSTGDIDLNEPVIGLANKKGGTGYWLVAKDGGIFSFGDAQFFGSMGDKELNAPILGMEATPSGRGYYLFAADGGIFSFGDAVFHGSTGDRKLNKPAVGLAVNQRGDGYWIVAQDGGIFSFGRVPFHGSTGDRDLNEPVFDMAPTAGDNGYWIVAKDGGVFSFGDAAGKFYGSAVGKATAPVIGMGATPSFNGYWIAAANGAVFHFGDALFLGDRRSTTDNAATVGFATVPRT